MTTESQQVEVAVQCDDFDPADLTPEIEARWVRDMMNDHKWLSPGMAEAIIDQYKRNPTYFTSDEFKERCKELAGKAQELRGTPSTGGYEHLTGDASEAYWADRVEQHSLTCEPLEQKCDE